MYPVTVSVRRKQAEEILEEIKKLLEEELTHPNLPDGNFLLPEHKVVEKLLQYLGYGGRTIRVRQVTKREAVLSLIEEDYENGVLPFYADYPRYLKLKCDLLGIDVSKWYLRKLVAEFRKSLEE